MASVGSVFIRSGNSVGWKKWQIAVAIGTPIIIGVGCWYYYSSKRRKDKRHVNDQISESTSRPASLTKVNGKTEADVNNTGSLEEKANVAKINGNRLFKEGKFEEAIKNYSEAIALCPLINKDSISTFYQNRAASYEKLKQYEKVVEDCTMALELNGTYIKALNRRAKAFEHLNKFEHALEDATAICVLEEFQNQSSLVLADRILKQLGQQRAKQAIKNCKPKMPCKNFIKTYFSSFAEDPVSKFIAEKQPDDATGFLKACRDFKNESYENIVEDCTAEIDGEEKQWKNLAILFRATFYILKNQPDLANSELNSLSQLETEDLKLKSSALIKLASLEVQRERLDKAFEYFKIAEENDPKNTDIYHHRGQVNLLLDKIEDACEDFKKAVALNSQFAIAAVQKCYADYRLAHSKSNSSQLQTALEDFKKTVEKHRESAEGFALYAQALVDQQKFQEANKYYNNALALDPYNANIYVHKGLLLLNWKQDFKSAIQLIEQAIEVDDNCEFAFETLGALEVQKGNLDRALDLFDKALASARTEQELAHLYSLRDAAAAQKRVASRLGIDLPKFE